MAEQTTKTGRKKKPHDVYYACCATRKNGELVADLINVGGYGTEADAKEKFKAEHNIQAAWVSPPVRKKNMQQQVASQSNKFVQIPFDQIKYLTSGKQIKGHAMGWHLVGIPLAEVSDKQGNTYSEGETFLVTFGDEPVDPNNRQPKPRKAPPILRKEDIEDLQQVSK